MASEILDETFPSFVRFPRPGKRISVSCSPHPSHLSLFCVDASSAADEVALSGCDSPCSRAGFHRLALNCVPADHLGKLVHHEGVSGTHMHNIISTFLS